MNINLKLEKPLTYMRGDLIILDNKEKYLVVQGDKEPKLLNLDKNLIFGFEEVDGSTNTIYLKTRHNQAKFNIIEVIPSKELELRRLTTQHIKIGVR